ncbi:hypothetical protein [Agrilutibacter solisilvae]|uniref:Uncharacterized protein n=1 Tax=Agrilutibacter solisilvae TaxID=2763317 RepID=A0A974Y2H1_9GAMM|nr:hypothetical protein [Lysobacter solisilvae]QSX79385.1 hypothetical protein I8J32_005855 [Lysobacter solisilvae]
MKASALLFASLFTSGAALAQVADNLATPASLLRYVDTTDGVSRSEANDIAEAYFLRHVGCGNYSGIAESADSWVVEGEFGYTGAPIRGFLINKKTGAIASPVGPSYAHPGDMLGSNSSSKPTAQSLRGWAVAEFWS